MNVYSRVFITSAALASGPYNAGTNPGCRRISFDFSMYNTIYNIPVNTSFEFGSGGSYTTIPINAGAYSFTSIMSTMVAAMTPIISDVTVTRGDATGRMAIVALSTPTMNVRFTSSSIYLRSLLGFASTTYTGATVIAPNVMKIFPGTGLMVTISGIVLPTATDVILNVPWSDTGGAMFNDDSAVTWSLTQSQTFSAVDVTITNVFGDIVNLNGGDYLLILNLMS